MKRLLFILIVCLLFCPGRVEGADPWHGQSLRDLIDTDKDSAPADGDSLLWDESKHKWEFTAYTIDNLTDFSVTLPTNGQALIYNSTTSKWTNQNPAPLSATYLTSTSNATLTGEVDLGALTSGFIYGTVAGGTSTISSVGSTGTGNVVLATSPTISGELNISDAGPHLHLTVTGGDVFGLHAETDLLYLKNDTDGKYYFLADSGHNVNLVPYTTDGKVGINKGLGTPGFNLDVTGTCNITSNLTVGGTITGNFSIGSDKEIVFNDGGVLSAENNFIYDKASKVLYLYDSTDTDYIFFRHDGTGAIFGNSGGDFDFNPDNDIRLGLADSDTTCFGDAKDATMEFDGNSFNIIANAVTAADDLELTADDTTVKLGDNAGTKKLYIKDSDAVIVSQINSDGGAYFATAVGIGTDAPAEKLEVFGDIQATDAGPNINLKVTGGDTFGLHAETDLLYLKNDTDTRYYFLADSNHNLNLVPYTTDGRVGINLGLGTPGYNLEVNGTFQADDYYSGGGTQGGTATTGGLTFTDGLYISGTSSGATAALDNLASVAINTSLISDTDSTDDLGSSSKYWANTYSDQVYTTGNVGIGTATPSEKLEIYSGNGKITSVTDSTIQFLAHYDGVDGATTYTNETGEIATFVNSAQLDTAQSKWTSSLLCARATSDYVTYPDLAKHNFGSSDFTIKFWIRMSSADGTEHGIIGQYVDGTHYWGMDLRNSVSQLTFRTGGAGVELEFYCTPTYSADTWYYVEFTRSVSGNTGYIFVNGTSQDVTHSGNFNATFTDVAAVLTVGNSKSSLYTNGWIEELEILNTLGHTSNYTVPSAPSAYVSGGNLYVAQKVGIGTTSPSTILDLLGADNSTCETIKINAAQASVTTADTFIDFKSTTGSEGSIAGTAVAGVIAFNTFTGSHYTQIVDKTGLEVNMLLEAISEKITDWSYDIERVHVDDVPRKDLEGKVVSVKNEFGEDEIVYDKVPHTEKINMSSNASPKEQLFKSRICNTRQSKSAIGAYGGTDKENRDLCLSMGTGFLIVANKGENIEIGDLLMSSDVKGCAEKQGDDILRNYSIGKATEPIVWQDGETKRTISVILLGG